MPPLSGKQRRAQLKLKRAAKRGDVQPRGQGQRSLESQFVRLDKRFLDDTRARAGSIVLARPIRSDVAVLRREWTTPTQLTLPRRPRWRYEMSRDELDANEQAHFRAWLAQQDAIVNCQPGDPTGDSDMPHPPNHFERNIEVWRQFWRVTEISQILLVLLDSRCPPLHLPTSLSAYLAIPTASAQQSDPSSRSRQSKAPRVILVLTKVDIAGPARVASWTLFLNENHPGVPVVPVEAYAQKPSVEQGPTRYEPHIPATFRERLVGTLRDVHEQLLQPPQWITTPRIGESDEERLQRTSRWRPRVKTVIDWDGVLRAKGKLVGKAVGGAAVPKGRDIERDDVHVSDSEEGETSGAHEWKEPEFLTVGVIGHPNVGKSSLLNAIFGMTRVRASRTPGKTKHFQTLFWTSDVRLVDCPGLVMPSSVPMDIQVLSGVLPVSRIAAVPFCVHQLAQLLPLEEILELTHPSLAASSTSSTTATLTGNRDPTLQPDTSSANLAMTKDKRTWRPGHRPVAQTHVQSGEPRWTANDIMTAYAEKKGWVTAKAGRPDVHRAGNAILRLVAEGKIPWAFWPPGGFVSGEDGIWLKGGIRQWDELDKGRDDDDSETEEFSNDDEASASGEAEEDTEEENEFPSRGGHLGRFGALSVD